MDGKCAGAGLGKEGQMPYDDLVLEDDILLAVQFWCILSYDYLQ